MKSSLVNMVLCLGAITLVASAGLGYVYTITKAPIEAAKSNKTTNALSQVIETFDNNPAEETTEIELDGMPIKVYTGRQGTAASGYAVETMTKAGFSGEVKLMVGFKPDGTIYNIEVLQHNETPGLGSKMADPGNPLVVSFAGKNPANMKLAVTKDGGDVDAITASTISSRAYVDAVERAYRAYQQVALGVTEAPVDYVAAVLPAYASVADESTLEIDGSPVVVHSAAANNGEVAGYAVQAETSNGYHGTIRLMVGFLPDATIHNIAVMQHNETPDFGAVIENEDNPLLASLKGKKASELTFTLKAGSTTDADSGATAQAAASDADTGATTDATAGSAEGDVDGITGATVTSKAYIEAVRRAYDGLKAITDKKGGE